MLTGEPVFLDERVCVGVFGHGAGRTRDDWHANLHRCTSGGQEWHQSEVYARVLTDGTRLGLVTKGVDDLGAGSNEGQTGRFDFRCEDSVLGEETVSSEPPSSQRYQTARLDM